MSLFGAASVRVVAAGELSHLETVALASSREQVSVLVSEILDSCRSFRRVVSSTVSILTQLPIFILLLF